MSGAAVGASFIYKRRDGVDVSLRLRAVVHFLDIHAPLFVPDQEVDTSDRQKCSVFRLMSNYLPIKITVLVNLQNTRVTVCSYAPPFLV